MLLRVLFKLVCLLKRVEKPPWTKFRGSMGNPWRLPAYWDFRLITCACEFERQRLL